MSVTRAERRALRGAALLDQHRPGWERELELYLLNMHSCSNCVLGQLYGTYENGCHALNVDRIRDEPEHFGFEGDDGVSYHDLDKAWTKIITERTKE